MKHAIFHLLIVFSLFSCQRSPDAQKIVDQAIEASGGALYENSIMQFDFREHTYLLELKEGVKKRMSRTKLTDSTEVIDFVGKDGFSRLINQKEVQVPDSMAFKYTESINSVIYFALLPYQLNDPAVKKTYLGKKELKGETYHKIQVTFSEKGGGVDFQDVYVYWFDVKDFSMDYLAYSFEVNGGGYRFREAYNQREVGGIQFADYINYKPKEDPTSVADLDVLFKNEKLEQLSRIDLKSISVSSATF